MPVRQSTQNTWLTLFIRISNSEGNPFTSRPNQQTWTPLENNPSTLPATITIAQYADLISTLSFCPDFMGCVIRLCSFFLGFWWCHGLGSRQKIWSRRGRHQREVCFAQSILHTRLILISHLRLAPNKPLPKPVLLGPSDTLKILLTAKEDRKPKRPHQAFLLVKDPATSLETSYALSVKDNGKGKVELVKLLPVRSFVQGTNYFNAGAKGSPHAAFDFLWTTFCVPHNCIIWFFEALSQPRLRPFSQTRS